MLTTKRKTPDKYATQQWQQPKNQQEQHIHSVTTTVAVWVSSNSKNSRRQHTAVAIAMILDYAAGKYQQQHLYLNNMKKQ